MVNPAFALAFFFEENAARFIASPESSGIEPFITTLALWLIFLVETVGVLVIAFGFFFGDSRVSQGIWKRQKAEFFESSFGVGKLFGVGVGVPISG